MHRLALLCGVVGLSLVACSSGPDRTELTKEGISIVTLKSWGQTRQRGTTVFRDPKSRATIALRAVPFDGPEVGQRDLDRVIASTELVLKRLPGAKMTRASSLPREDVQARVFELSFVPKGKRKRYERRHAVLIGDNAIYHVWLTAPKGQLKARAKVFDQVVDSLREEV